MVNDAEKARKIADREGSEAAPRGCRTRERKSHFRILMAAAGAADLSTARSRSLFTAQAKMLAAMSALVVNVPICFKEQANQSPSKRRAQCRIELCRPRQERCVACIMDPGDRRAATRDVFGQVSARLGQADPVLGARDDRR